MKKYVKMTQEKLPRSVKIVSRGNATSSSSILSNTYQRVRCSTVDDASGRAHVTQYFNV